jgi:nodulation protein E
VSERRVVVTGIGVISALGPDRTSFWQALAQGRSGIRPMESIDGRQFRFQNGAEVAGYDPKQHFDEKLPGLTDRFAQFAIVAAREAVKQSGIEFAEPTRTAIVTGSCVGGQGAMDDGFVEMYRKGLPRVSPMMIPRVMANSGASQISMEFGITGPTYTVSTACSSSNHAIGQAYHMVRHGLVDSAITGGSEAVFSFGFLKAWEAMRVVSPDTCRPFSKDRRGLILGEGAAMLVLETLEAARGRGALILAEVVGFGMSSDAHHITQPSPDGAALAMTAAMRDGGIAREAIGYINAHGTGTAINDVTETAAIRKAFGAHADRIAVSSTKSMHGHALGAAGAIEAAATILGLVAGVIPPTANFTEADPQCDLDVVANAARVAGIEVALSNSFAFGGLNAVVAFRSPSAL